MWTKISILVIDNSGLKRMEKSGLELFFEIHRAPSESLLPSAEKSRLAGISEGAP